MCCYAVLLCSAADWVRGDRYLDYIHYIAAWKSSREEKEQGTGSEKSNEVKEQSSIASRYFSIYRRGTTSEQCFVFGHVIPRSRNLGMI